MRKRGSKSNFGIRIARRALEALARQIASNAGEDGSIIVGKIVDNKNYAWGYDAQSGTYGDLVGSGIIDWKRIFVQSEKAGIKHYIVEHDNPANPFESITKSYEYLEKLRF